MTVETPTLLDNGGCPAPKLFPVSSVTTGGGSSMASPHVAGLAALVVQEHGRRQGRSGYSLDPDTVALIIENSATDHACPAGGVEIYTDEGRPAEFNAICEGTTDDNGLYGGGIANAAAAVARQ